MRIIPLFTGFPGRSDRGYLGWSSCVLIFGEDGTYLFDTLGFNERYELLAELERQGVAPNDIDVVFLSHFHFDHAVNYRLFPNAKLLLHQRELEYARQEHQRDLAVPIEMLDDLAASGRLELLVGERGTAHGIEWLLTPGHTAGLYSLLIEVHGGVTVLASDAVKNLGELLVGESAMAWSKKASKGSIATILALASRIVPGHDDPVEVLAPHVASAPGDVEVGALRLRQTRSKGVTISLASEVPGEQRHWNVRQGGHEPD